MVFTAPFAGVFGSGAPGITPLTANLLAWLEGDFGTYQSSGGTAAVADGDPVGECQDKSGNGEHATQTTTAAKPTLRLGANGIGGKAALQFDGTDAMVMTLSSTALAYTFYFVIDPDTQSGQVSYLYDAETGRLVLMQHSGSDTTKVGWFDGAGAFINIANATHDPQILTFALGGGTGTIYRNGVSLGSATYTAVNLGGNQRLGARFGETNRFAGLMGAVLVYGVKHNAAQMLNNHTYLSAKYGIAI